MAYEIVMARRALSGARASGALRGRVDRRTSLRARGPETPPQKLPGAANGPRTGSRSLSGVGEVLRDWRVCLPALKPVNECRAVDCTGPRLAAEAYCRECRARFIVRYDANYRRALEARARAALRMGWLKQRPQP